MKTFEDYIGIDQDTFNRMERAACYPGKRFFVHDGKSKPDDSAIKKFCRTSDIKYDDDVYKFWIYYRYQFRGQENRKTSNKRLHGFDREFEGLVNLLKSDHLINNVKISTNRSGTIKIENPVLLGIITKSLRENTDKLSLEYYARGLYHGDTKRKIGYEKELAKMLLPFYRYITGKYSLPKTRAYGILFDFFTAINPDFRSNDEIEYFKKAIQEATKEINT